MHEVADVIKSGARSYQPPAQKYFYRFAITSNPIKSVQLPRNGPRRRQTSSLIPHLKESQGCILIVMHTDPASSSVFLCTQKLNNLYLTNNKKACDYRPNDFQLNKF